ncbi:flavodoxin domain-containing protein [Roseicella aquatilis]|uniref:NADPH--hemoprotein reductase n=1 Tax=Roseicella aquatilis TaxID=2527868 RepID=A0A4R4DI60_9PROT|nr:flavodoxin domain-containing protein [Roseicella aquatilis]TCZ60840.1 sulfite reductase flavoprotein subunit alpha [Roseicella aquatilis]
MQAALTTDPRRLLAALAVALLYAAFCLLVALRARRRHRAEAGEGAPALLVAHASQTGFAEDLARRSADALRAGAVAVRVAALGTLTAETLAAGRILFVVSTTGEGDAPDSAARFLRRVMAGRPDLSRLSFGILALGDSSYAQYCAFGRVLDAWLRQCGARPLFERIEVDDGEAGALRQWQAQLGHLVGTAALPDWEAAPFEEWRLVERRLLNPGSQGGPAFHLALEPIGGMPRWCAGDIAEVAPRNAPGEVEEFRRRLGLGAVAGLEERALPREPAAIAVLAGLPSEEVLRRLPPLPRRDYSIASLPEDGRLELLVRQARHPDGRLGLGSGWLTGHAPLGGHVALRLRSNRAFHPPEPGRPLVLIGNGTGLAGLRAHLRARRAAGERRNWLVFGERNRARDFFHAEEIESWRAEGWLQRLDLAFSRDGTGRVYVQERLREAAEELRRWVAEGAALYVCGSREGMAGGVQAALAEILGTESLDALTEAGRYRRDIY